VPTAQRHPRRNPSLLQSELEQTRLAVDIGDLASIQIPLAAAPLSHADVITSVIPVSPEVVPARVPVIPMKHDKIVQSHFSLNEGIVQGDFAVADIQGEVFGGHRHDCLLAARRLKMCAGCDDLR
jgi:hypothetical protein